MLDHVGVAERRQISHLAKDIESHRREAMGMRRALRQALGTPPNSRDLDTVFEPHARGSILVDAVFDVNFLDPGLNNTRS